jgi:GTP1/Obg family GTP-binding protein
MNEEQAKEKETRKKSLIKTISEGVCGHCRKPRGEHSRKNMLRCFYTSDYNLYHAILKIKELEKQIEDMGKKKKKIKNINSKESENLNALATGKDPDDVQ